MNSYFKLENKTSLNFVEQFNQECSGCNKCRCLMMNDLDLEMKSFSKLLLTESFHKKNAFSCVGCNKCVTLCSQNLKPKAIFDQLKWDINNQVKDKLIFNTPYPLFKTVKVLPLKKQFGKIAFMAGCSMNRNNSSLKTKVLQLLKTSDESIFEITECCSKPLSAIGQKEKSRQHLENFKNTYHDTLIITGCFSCEKVLKPYVNVINIYDYLLDQNLVPKISAESFDLKIPCHLTNHNSLVRFCDELGINVENIDDTCCGSGGLIGLSNQSLSKKYLAQSVLNLKSEKVICACAQCNKKISKHKNSVHILELI